MTWLAKTILACVLALVVGWTLGTIGFVTYMGRLLDGD